MCSSDLIEVVDDDDDGSPDRGEPVVWCSFPLAQRGHDDVEAAFDGLSLLQQLLPPPVVDHDVWSGASGHTNGRITCDRRFKHGESFGKTWMQTSELEMMIALLLRDGRYENRVCIIPLRIMVEIRECFKFFKQCWKVTKCRKTAEDRAKERAPGLASELFKKLEEESPEEAHEKKQEWIKCHVHDTVMADLAKHHPGIVEKEVADAYDKQQARLIDLFLKHHPWILDKQIIVFPLNFGNQHWGATFVFHARRIEYCGHGSISPCFFRYCSMKVLHFTNAVRIHARSEERRVGKEC